MVDQRAALDQRRTRVGVYRDYDAYSPPSLISVTFQQASQAGPKSAGYRKESLQLPLYLPQS